MFELTDKVAIVTGGARGIGKGISIIMAKQGASVAIADILEEEAKKTVEEIEKQGGKAMAVKTDITDLEQVKQTVAKVKEEFGPVDILVNNAGWDRITPFIKTTPDLWEKVIAINYKGVINFVYAVIPDMMKRNTGRIISIASDAARVGSTGEAVYSGAKGAVISFSKTMARELARNKITVNVICPGPTPTPLLDEIKESDEFAKKILSGMERYIPLGRLGSPEDIACAVVFFASDEANFITGQTLSVSGGLTMA
ncbi:MAG: 2-hydroxycyclohexanecarboxyl-CoA dehydrogenase [Deltaproteobacteria bacterium]|nr:MAG: 2-hydroxycyclohexanecarboxyl-CoA dehydrogenase [Deltaproteobacteria bacterium]